MAPDPHGDANLAKDPRHGATVAAMQQALPARRRAAIALAGTERMRAND